MTDISTHIIELVKENFSISEDLSKNQSFIESGLLKSMQLIELLFDLEDEYDIEFDFNDLDVSEVESPVKIENYIMRHINA